MMKKIFAAAFFLLLFTVVPASENRSMTIAFLPFSNMTGNQNYNYLCELIPNGLTFSFRNSNYDAINATTSVKYIKTLLKEESQIQPEKYMQISHLLSANYLIHGSFSSTASGKSFIIRVFNNKLNEYISFETDGDIETETEIFSLVDKLKKLLSELADNEYVYKTEKIGKTSRIAVVSNLSGKDYNEMLMEFLRSGHKVASLQGNEVNNEFSYREIDFFYSLSARHSAIEKPFKHSPKILIVKPWISGKRIAEEEQAIALENKMIYAVKEETVKSISSLSGVYGGLDYIFFINIDESKDRFWLRCVNSSTGKLIWIESGALIKNSNESIFTSAVKLIVSKYSISTE